MIVSSGPRFPRPFPAWTALIVPIALAVMLSVPPVGALGRAPASMTPPAGGSLAALDGTATPWGGAHLSGRSMVIAPRSTVDLGALLHPGPLPSESATNHPSYAPFPSTFALANRSDARTAPVALVPAASASTLHVWHSASGLSASQAGGGIPPDVQIASGPRQEMEFVNTYTELFNATGASLGSTYLGTFFGSGTDFLSDPKVIYDNESGRWFASVLHINTGQTAADNLLAVSSSSNATGTWTTYSVPDQSGDLGDQPILGLNSALISISVNEFASGSYDGAQFWVINKTSALSGGPLQVTSFGPYASDLSIHPVDSVSPNTTTLYLAETDPTTSGRIDLYAANGVPPASVTVTKSTISVASFSSAPSAVQPGTGDRIDTGDARVQSAVLSSGRLWLTFTETCTPSGDTQARSCLRLVELYPSNLTVRQDFSYGVAGSYLFYPALAVDPSGGVTVVYGESSTSMYASLLATAQQSTDPVGSLETPVVLKAGSSSTTSACSQGVCRYGDYFGASRSPLGAGTWLAGEFIAPGDSWSTQIDDVSPTRTPPSPSLSVLPASVDAGQTVTVTLRLANSPCVNSTSPHCSLYLPIGPSTVVLSCVSPLVAVNASVTLPASGTYALGSLGYVLVYPSASCTGPPSWNLSVPPVALVVSQDPTVRLVPSAGFPVEVNESFTVQAPVTGGQGPFTYLWSHAPSGCTGLATASLTCAPTVAGTGTLSVRVTDGNHATASAMTGWVVDSNPSVTLTSSTLVLEAGQPLDLVAMASGGIGRLSYTWSGLPAGCRGANVSALTCTLTGSGSANVSVTVRDAAGFLARGSTGEITVYPAVTVTARTSAASVSVGRAVNFTAEVVGGRGNVTYVWSGLPAGCRSANSDHLMCRPARAGNATVEVTVVDQLGGRANSSVSLDVAPAPPPSGHGSNAGPLSGAEWDLLLVLLGVATVAGVVAVAIRRRPPRETTRP